MKGIFALRNKAALRGLGTNENVPYWCWNMTGFQSCMNTQLVNAQTYCRSQGMADDPVCVENQQGVMQQFCIDDCIKNQPTDPAAVTTTTPADTTGGGATVCPPGTWNAPDNMSCVKSSGKCTDSTVIAFVQGQLGVDTDGKWGPKSAAALKASGKQFKDIAIGCDGTTPGGGSGTGGGISKITPKSGGVKQGTTQADFLGIPLIAWAGVAAIAVVLLLKKKKATPNRRRRHHRHHR